MKPSRSHSNRRNAPPADRTATAFTVLLFVAGFALLLGNNLGVLPQQQMERLWPVALVAAGLVGLLEWRGRQEY